MSPKIDVEKVLLQELMTNSPDYIFIKDRQSRFIITNKAHARNLLGLNNPEDAVGKTDFDLFPGKQDDSKRFFDEEQSIMESGKPVINRQWLVPSTTTGETVWLSESKLPIRDESGEVIGLFGLGRDITVHMTEEALREIIAYLDQVDLKLLEFVATKVSQVIERKHTEKEILGLSMTDELTGLFNRRGFTMLAEQEVKMAHRMKRSMLLFFGDVDNLKTINDTHGHAQGDLALKQVSAVLKEIFREADIPARYGGDEFVVLAVDASMESAKIMTSRIQGALKRCNQQGNWPYQLSLSLGIAHYDPEAPCTVSELITQADGLMYAQKKARKVTT